MNNYLSIKEFAQKVGYSTQAIYNRLDKDLAIYVKDVGGKKTLSDEAIAMFTAQKNQKEETKIDALASTLQDAVKILSSQLEQKDNQLKELNERLKEAQALNKNNQVLLIAEQSKYTLKKDANESKETKKGLFGGLFKSKNTE